jgi:hypothetical protein
MNKCEHDPIIVNGNIKCRLCGEILKEMEVIVTTVQSGIQARRIVDQIIVGKDYIPDRINGQGYVVHIKTNNGIFEELTIDQKATRSYAVIRKLTIE